MIELFTIVSLFCCASAFQASKFRVQSKISFGVPLHRLDATSRQAAAAENELTKLLEASNEEGRGAKSSVETLDRIQGLIKVLEDSTPKRADPVGSPLLDGCWKLLYTSSPGTNSPIQRTFTAFDGVTIFQIVNILDTEGSFLPGNLPDVSNTVCFGDSARLRVTALASTASDPRIEPRKGDGKIFGFNVFGISSSTPPRNPNERIDFAFQDAQFEFNKIPVPNIPYPVPFKLLGDEAKGWIDVTYLSKNYRISRGNKGTTFVLQKVMNTADDPIAQFAVADLKPTRRSNGQNTANTPDRSVKDEETTKLRKAKPLKPTIADRPIINVPAPKRPGFFKSGLFQKTAGSEQGDVSNNNNGSSKTKKQAVIVFPAQLGTEGDYQELLQSLKRVTTANSKDTTDTSTGSAFATYVVPLSRLDWPVGLLPSFLSPDYRLGTLKPQKTLDFYFRRVDEAVARALEENDADVELVLVAHSIGGWIARAWLSEHCAASVRTRVRTLLTLGSPHNAPPPDSALANLDQTRGLLTYINTYYPGAYEDNVKYVSVIGSEISGRLSLLQPQALLAYFSYLFLGGSGATAGDGIIPVETSALPGAQEVIIKGVKHTNYVPTPVDTSIRLPWRWYGSENVVEEWVQYL